MIPVLEVGGTHVTAALVDLARGEVAWDRRYPLDSGGSADEILDALASAARTVDGVTEPWGVATPGPFDYERGIGRFETVGKFDSLAGVDVGAGLVDRLGLVMRPHFVNDADAFGIGEAVFGAGSGHVRVVCLTLGTGVGSAFVAGGEPVKSGPDVPPDGSAHLLSWQGCPLEETVSARAIRRLFAERAPDGLDVREIASLARRGDEWARAVVTNSALALGECLGPWVERFGATAVVLGGSIAQSFDLIEAPFREGLLRSRAFLDVAVVSPLLPHHAALLGTARTVRPNSDVSQFGAAEVRAAGEHSSSASLAEAVHGHRRRR